MNRTIIFAWFLLATVSFAVIFQPTPAVAQAAANEEAKRHFTNGVRLFEDRNFAGALVEFEASFQQNPTAVALQNIAVCQKGLFRYAEAIATLERMLASFAGQLSSEDKKAAEEAIREMSALLGTIVLKVTPADARVSINDALISADALKNPLRLAAGEYRIAAEAPGYARQERIVTVVSGQKDRPIAVTLSPLSGTLVIRAHDSDAAIALDGVQVGYDEWKGPVSAGPHEIYVYTSKLRHKSNVVAYAGQTTEFEAKLTPGDRVPADHPAPASGPPPYVPPSQRGIFAFLTVGADSMGSSSPEGVNQNKARTAGSVGGIIVGYRFSTLFAAEFQAAAANHSIAACPALTGVTGCPGDTSKYGLQSSRIGPAMRLMTNGRKGRFVATIGIGAAVHSISYEKGLSDAPTSKKDVSAVGSYVSLEGGYELNLGHFLLDAAIDLTGETLDETKTSLKNAGSVGFGLRLGYGQW